MTPVLTTRNNSVALCKSVDIPVVIVESEMTEEHTKLYKTKKEKDEFMAWAGLPPRSPGLKVAPPRSDSR